MWYILALLIFGLTAGSMVQAHAVFWDLLISSEIQNDPIPLGGYPELVGRIVDHGDNVVVGANVSVRTLGHTEWLVTDENGEFAYTFNETMATPGLHSVVTHATYDVAGDQKIGFADVTYRVDGGAGLSAEEKILSTKEAKKYLEHDGNFTNDLIGYSLYKYYQSVQQKHLDNTATQQKLQEHNYNISQSRILSINHTKQLVSEDEAKTGHISKYSYERLISNTDPSIRNDVIRQLNYTMELFLSAENELKSTQNSTNSSDNTSLSVENNPFSHEILNLILQGYSQEDVVNKVYNVNSSQNITTDLNSTQISDLVEPNILANLSGEENVMLAEPVYGMHISATALNWDIPPFGTSINLTGSAIGLSPTGNIMIGINGSLVEFKLHMLNIIE